jgi:hypothetical protein
MSTTHAPTRFSSTLDANTKWHDLMIHHYQTQICSKHPSSHANINNGILSPCSIRPQYPAEALLIAVELLENQMQEQININPDSPVAAPIASFSKQIHELVVVKLRLQQPIEWYLRKRAWNHHATLRPLDLKDTRLIRRDGEFEAIPRALRVAVPRNQNALLSEVTGRVLEGAKAVGAAGGFEFAHVVVLAGEGEKELLLALFGLQRYHGLLDIVVVRLELLLEEVGFLVQRSERRAHAFHLTRALHPAPVLGADVDCDRVEQVLVVVVGRDAACALELDHVFQTVLLESGIIEFQNRV